MVSRQNTRRQGWYQGGAVGSSPNNKTGSRILKALSQLSFQMLTKEILHQPQIQYL